MFKRLAPLAPVAVPVLLVVGLLVALSLHFHVLQLLPKKELTMAAGRPGGGYYQIAEQYKALLAKDGISLTILDTPGSMENSRLIATGKADVALLQGGTPVSNAVGLQALAGVFLEPFFIFHRASATNATDLNAWNDLRIAAGEPGSGTRVAINGMTQALEVNLDQEKLMPLSGAEATDALLAGDIDVAVFVAPVSAPYLEPLFADETIEIGTLRDAEALARRVSFIRSGDIPPAGLDYSRRLPRERVELTTMIATLAATGDLHPSLVNRLVRAAQEIHSAPNLVSADLTFPNVEGLELPLNQQASKLITSGPSVLESIFPYWIAAQITRVTLILIPLLVLLVPLFRTLPGIYAWSMRSRVYRRYNELVAIDIEAEGDTSEQRRGELLARLEQIDREAKAVKVPARYREYVYTLRLHIDLVRSKLHQI